MTSEKWFTGQEGSEMIEFSEVNLEARAPDASDGGKWKSVPLVQRIDPLTRKSSRILSGVKLQPASKPELSEITNSGGFCPFCDEFFEKVTFEFEPEVVPAGRIRRNKAAVVPNIMAYSGYSAVGVYDTSCHFTRLDEFSPELLFDAFSVMVDHAKAIRTARPDLVWSSISANYLPPSGSSVVHPHLQSSHDFQPMTNQMELVEGARRYYLEDSSSYFDDLVAQEENGSRYIGKTGSVSWLTPFAPRGFQEIWGVFERIGDVHQLTQQSIADLSDGVSKVFAYYDSRNFSAFNFSLAGGGPDGESIGFRLVFRILVRSNPEKYYRSDVTYFERLLDEPLLDVAPEEVAIAAAEMFR